MSTQIEGELQSQATTEEIRGAAPCTKSPNLNGYKVRLLTDK
jgi:hypothetical protein